MRSFFSGGFSNTLQGFGSSLVLVLYDDIKKYLASLKEEKTQH